MDMKVTGKSIADSILEKIHTAILDKKISPKLVILNASPDASSQVYIGKKIKAAAKVGIKAEEIQFSEDEESKAEETIAKLNTDSTVHGMIMQLPIYNSWNRNKFIKAIADEKDVDGFKEHSKFMGATALGVWEMLGAFAQIEGNSSTEEFLADKIIVIVGKGITAGKPTMELLLEKGLQPRLVDSSTQNPDDIFKNADVIISASGQKHIIHAGNIKEGSYIIGIGMSHETVNGEDVTFGDINPNIEEKAKLYCPTVGGIGPLTVACLLRNVLEASERLA